MIDLEQELKAQVAGLKTECRSLYDRIREGCTCGSGGHPRHCKRHPGAFDAHCRSLSEAHQLDELLGAMKAIEAILARGATGPQAESIKEVVDGIDLKYFEERSERTVAGLMEELERLRDKAANFDSCNRARQAAEDECQRLREELAEADARLLAAASYDSCVRMLADGITKLEARNRELRRENYELGVRLREVET